MIGRRVYASDRDGQMWYAPGDYGKDLRDGIWYARPPTVMVHTGSLAAHHVMEHTDGTITVTPSILITGYDGNGGICWHGFLEHGVWREVT